MKKLVVAFGLLLSLTACASVDAALAPLAQEEPTHNAVQTIGLVSVIGDSMVYKNIAAKSGASDTTRGDTTSWGIDQFAQSQLAAKIDPDYKTVPIDVDRAALKSADIKKSVGDALRASLKPGQPPVDLYLVLFSTSSRDYISDTHQTLSGLGIYRRKGSGIQVFAACDLQLIDAKTFEMLAGGQLGSPDKHLTTDDYLNGSFVSKAMQSGEQAHKDIDPKLASANAWYEFTPAELEKVKAETESLVKNSLDYPLSNIGLAPRD